MLEDLWNTCEEIETGIFGIASNQDVAHYAFVLALR